MARGLAGDPGEAAPAQSALAASMRSWLDADEVPPDVAPPDRRAAERHHPRRGRRPHHGVAGLDDGQVARRRSARRRPRRRRRRPARPARRARGAGRTGCRRRGARRRGTAARRRGPVTPRRTPFPTSSRIDDAAVADGRQVVGGGVLERRGVLLGLVGQGHPRLQPGQRRRHRRGPRPASARSGRPRPRRSSSSRRPASMRCTAPVESRCTIVPSNRYVTVASPMCGCGGTSAPRPGASSSGPIRSAKMNGPTIRRAWNGSSRSTSAGPDAAPAGGDDPLDAHASICARRRLCPTTPRAACRRLPARVVSDLTSIEGTMRLTPLAHCSHRRARRRADRACRPPVPERSAAHQPRRRARAAPGHGGRRRPHARRRRDAGHPLDARPRPGRLPVRLGRLVRPRRPAATRCS